MFPTNDHRLYPTENEMGIFDLLGICCVVGGLKTIGVEPTAAVGFRLVQLFVLATNEAVWSNLDELQPDGAAESARNLSGQLSSYTVTSLRCKGGG